jgi:hypothetical protein
MNTVEHTVVDGGVIYKNGCCAMKMRKKCVKKYSTQTWYRFSWLNTGTELNPLAASCWPPSVITKRGAKERAGNTSSLKKMITAHNRLKAFNQKDLQAKDLPADDVIPMP